MPLSFIILRRDSPSAVRWLKSVLLLDEGARILDEGKVLLVL